MTPLSRLMQGMRREDGDRLRIALDVTPDWAQGRSVLGGLQLAFALAAMRHVVPALPVRALQATFFAPSSGMLRAEPRVVRAGKNVTYAEAHLVNADGIAMSATGVFGAPRATVVDAPLEAQQPVIPDGAPRVLPFIDGVTPAFIQHFRAAFVRGNYPFSGVRDREQVLTLDLIDEGPCTEQHVVTIADFMPPIGLTHLSAPAPGSTATWLLELLVDAPQIEKLALSGWRVDGELVAARDGYTHQSSVIWGPGGVPVALSRQTMMVFA